MSFFRNYQKLIVGCLCVMLLFLTAGCSIRNQKPEAAEHNWPTDDTVISLYLHQTGETVELSLREYLYGVVAAEMDVKWPVEALAAQAIMARTFTLEKLEDGGVPERGTDASTDIHEFQAYDAGKINERVKQAVDETENQVAVYNGELIKAWFFADGGGRTASSALEGLSYDKEETPYIKSVEDPGASHPDNPNRSWEVAFSMKEVAEAVEQVTGIRKDTFKTVKIAERGESGRVIRYQFDDITVGAAAFRLALGGEKLKSALVEEIIIAENRLLVKGKGYGHGVGMSQWGARVLAEDGKNAQEIVQYFFDGIEIVQVQP
ncbi:MAG: SpoIID/LytB domain-containing protein [Peptococcaceae bacterium]|nr:SpoIID/LytB domain-containing protein [Peptococcaceae bacterium]